MTQKNKSSTQNDKFRWMVWTATLATLALHAVEGAAQELPLRASDTESIVVQRALRLSDWLISRPDAMTTSQGDAVHLSWLSSGRVAAQRDQQQELVLRLKGRFSALAALLESMPATGRIPFSRFDARWLEVHPAFDPVLQPGDRIVRTPRPGWLTVLLPSGHLCQVRHQPGATVQAYLAACAVNGADRAWVIQPDGSVSEVGVASWSETLQSEPAPGAWIWAPERTVDVSERESRALAKFLATQVAPPAAYPWRQARRISLDAEASSGAARAPRGLYVSSNQWGTVGLLQTPTARMEAEGTAALMYGRTAPYGVLKARLQPVEWLSFDFGYVNISDLRYGPAALSGDQSYKDKSADLKVRIFSESFWVPQIALGLRDLLGTGFFASEYLVASKRFGDVDISGGLAFGYMGGRQDIGNPLGKMWPRFRSRPGPGSQQGGEFNTRGYFRGPAAFFGGMQYQLPWDRWLLKLEYEGNDYEHEPAGRPVHQSSPFNLGLIYRWTPWLDLAVGLERGNRAAFMLSAHTQLDGLKTFKYLDPKRLPVAPAPASAVVPAAQTARDIERQADVHVTSIDTDGLRMTVTLSNPEVGYLRPMVNKVAAVAHRDAAAQVEKISVRLAQQGVPVSEIDIDRKQWVRERTEYVPDAEGLASMSSRPVPRQVERAETPQGQTPYASDPSALSYGLAVYYRQNLGGPDGFLLYQLGTDFQAQWQLGRGTWLAGTARLRLLDNYENFKYTAPSQLPRVRTYVREYLLTERLTLPHLQISQLGQLGSGGDHFYLAYAGLLESMFAGVGGEYLYRPVNSRLAMGVDVNRVQQRDFDQRLSMRDYKVTTGHVTAYWDTGLSDVLLKLSAGRYLAGDTGMTVDASRVFRNGVSIGAYATKTNVSAQQFGEGSFDKGVYVNIPFDAMLPRSGSGTASIVYAPLIRDGGAKLARRFTLFELTKARDPRALEFGDGQER
ncbi:MAG: YjbH domain-containing protein [Aquabacterium sp.]